MAITLNSNDFLLAVKTGIAKVRDAKMVSMSADRKKLTLQFNGEQVRYQSMLDCSKGIIPAASFDAAVLLKAMTGKSSELEISNDGPELNFKLGRSSLKLPINSTVMVDDIEDISDAEIANSQPSSETFIGWTKNHPLYSAIALKRSLQAIKDNIAKEELVVEAQWGKDDILKVKLVDQFHGVLCLIKLPSIPTKKQVHIRLPISSFLLLMDIKGHLYIDNTKVIVKDDYQTLSCQFISASSFGSIEDMLGFIKIKHQLTCDAKELTEAVKRIMALTEQDDAIQIESKKSSLVLSAQAVKGSLRTSLAAKGELPNAFSLPPKNLSDIVSCMSKTVQITDIGSSLVFTSINEGVTVHGALVKLEA